MSKGKTHKLSAYDMLFFGNGRPFTMEDESWTKGIFPPHPSTIYGFLRSTYFENNMNELGTANKNDDPTKDFEILKYSLCLEKEGVATEYYPIPFGNVLIKDENSEKEKIEKLILTENNTTSNNENSHILVAKSEGKVETLNNKYYITKNQLENYLKGNTITKWIDIRKYIIPEPRIGIATDFELQKTKDGQLYRIEFNHLNNPIKKEKISFKIEIVADHLLDFHIRSLGGEGKKAILEKFNNIEVSNQATESQQQIFNSAQEDTKNLQIFYFYTPLLLENLSEIEDFCIIQTIASDNFITISGWDIKNKKPKEANYAYPAGTVFFIEFKSSNSKKEFYETYNNRKIGKRTQEGFGAFYTGKHPNTK